MNAPFSGNVASGGIACASLYVVMCVSWVMASKADPVARAVTCNILVRYAIGLNNPESHTLIGVAKVSVHDVSCPWRLIMSAYCGNSDFFEGQENFSQAHCEYGLRPGHSLIVNAAIRSSIAWVMFSVPARPFSRSDNDLLITPNKTFMRRHSCKAQTT